MSEETEQKKLCGIYWIMGKDDIYCKTIKNRAEKGVGKRTRVFFLRN